MLLLLHVSELQRRPFKVCAVKEWKKLWDEAVSMATTYGVAVEPMRPRRNRRLPERLEDAVITAETIGNRDAPVLDYRVQVYYSTLDTILNS